MEDGAATPHNPVVSVTEQRGKAALRQFVESVGSANDRDAAVRAALDEVLPSVSPALRETCQGIVHTGRTLRQLLGPGSEAILPADDRTMKSDRLAAAMLMWARKRLCRSQTRNELVRRAVVISNLTRKLKQKMASRPPPTFASQATQRLIIYKGTTKLRFKMRSALWADAEPEPRLFEKAFEARSIHETGPSTGKIIQDLLIKRKKKKPGPDAWPIALPPTPPPLKVTLTLILTLTLAQL